jgi:heme exporter protein D
MVVILTVHVSFKDRQYNDQRKHGQTIQRPKETWTGNTTTKGNMDRQYNHQKKHGLVVVLPVHVSFGLCIACPCFFWSLYCLSMFLLIVVLSVQTIQRTKETWTDNTTTKRNMDRQYNDQQKPGETIQRPMVVVLSVHVSFGSCIACPCFFWSLYCLSMFLLVVVLSVHVSFGRGNMDRQ